MTKKPTAVLVFADGSYFFGFGHGSPTNKGGEVVFNTAMTGYQEILTDPSYHGQIVCFTFPHIGIVGCNDLDTETMPHLNIKISGAIMREPAGISANWRANSTLDDWLKKHDIPAISGIDTRALTIYIRDKGAPMGLIAVNYAGEFDLPALTRQAQNLRKLDNLDLAQEVTINTPNNEWDEALWNLPQNQYRNVGPLAAQYHVVALDFGAKNNIFRILTELGCRLTIVPANTPASAILALKPDGVFLSNGPGDPAATGQYAVPAIQTILQAKIPLFGICLGHQMLALAMGAKTEKMELGHHGANHPIWDNQLNKVIITSQNHGFMVSPQNLPNNVVVTHVSLFDKSIAGICASNAPAFSVQFHPEASPGPQDNMYLFHQFIALMAGQGQRAA